MNFPGSSAPVARPVGGGVDGLRFVLGVKEQPAADSDPAALEMVAQGASGPIFTALFGEKANARRDLDNDSMVFAAVHRIENQLDMSVAMSRVGGAAIDGLDAANLDVPNVAGDFGSTASAPAATIVAGLEEGGEGNARVDLLRVWRRKTIFQAVEFANGSAGSVAVKWAAVESLQIRAWEDALRCGTRAPEPENKQHEDEKERPEISPGRSHQSPRRWAAAGAGEPNRVFREPEFIGITLKVSRPGAGIVGELFVGNYGDVPASGKELHNLCAAASHRGPTRLGLGILFESAIGNAVQFEVDLSQAALGSAAD